jgi:HPt (histidine-containing phosphotransfer) domain-containing protein
VPSPVYRSFSNAPRFLPAAALAPAGIHRNFGISGSNSRKRPTQQAREADMMGLRTPAGAPAGEPPREEVRPIDLVHLARMTLGDRSVEREVLQLFVRQAAMLLARMEGADARSVAALAHTLKGSAQGLGAWRVAAAADLVEVRSGTGPDALAASVAALRAAVAEAQGVIADLLWTH